MPVEVLELRPRTVVEPLLGFGSARSERLSIVAAEIPGRIQFRAPELRPGAGVQAGTTLLQVDARDYQARLDRVTNQLAAEEALLTQIRTEKANLERLIEPARADFAAAQREYERLRTLLEAGNSNPRELDGARRSYEQSRSAMIELENQLAVLPQRERFQAATLEQREAELAMARMDLQRCEIKAPFDGTIESVQVETGAAVVPGQALFTILDPQHLEIPIELPVAMFDRVRVGATCELQLETNAEVIWRGEVKRLAASADVATRSFAAFVLVNNAEQPQPLKPGMFVKARIHGPAIENVLIVPREAVQRGCVFVLRGETAVRHPVHVERRLVDECVISGVRPGERVVVSNFGALFDGARVRSANLASSTRSVALDSASAPQPGGKTLQNSAAGGAR